MKSCTNAASSRVAGFWTGDVSSAGPAWRRRARNQWPATPTPTHPGAPGRAATASGTSSTSHRALINSMTRLGIMSSSLSSRSKLPRCSSSVGTHATSTYEKPACRAAATRWCPSTMYSGPSRPTLAPSPPPTTAGHSVTRAPSVVLVSSSGSSGVDAPAAARVASMTSATIVSRGAVTTTGLDMRPTSVKCTARPCTRPGWVSSCGRSSWEARRTPPSNACCAWPSASTHCTYRLGSRVAPNTPKPMSRSSACVLRVACCRCSLGWPKLSGGNPATWAKESGLSARCWACSSGVSESYGAGITVGAHSGVSTRALTGSIIRSPSPPPHLAHPGCRAPP